MTAQPIQVEYQRQAPKRESPRVVSMQKATLWCAIVPASVGLLELIGYWLTQSDLFAILGWLTLLTGGFTVVLAIIITLLSLVVAHRGRSLVSRSVWRAVVILLLLIANFPLAMLCQHTGEYLMDHPYCTLILTNTSPKTIEGGVLEFGSTDNPFDSIEPGKTAIVHRRMADDDRLGLVIKIDGKDQRMAVLDRDASPLRIDAKPVHIDIGDQTAERKD